MGRVTIDPKPSLFAILPFLLCSCGSGGGEYTPPPPVNLMAMAQDLGAGGAVPEELFTSNAPLKLTLAADFDQLGDDRDQESEERPAQLLVMGSDGEPVELPIQVRTRGNFRLQKRVCPDPNLRLNFQETSPKGTVFDGQDKMKLVAHCRDTDRYEQNLLEEYLVYRLYNQFTDLGFRAQLAEVTYLDTSGKNDPVTRMAFLIEDEDRMAERLNGMIVETSSANPQDFVLDQLSLVYLFQYMVGNIDWGTGVGHNIIILMKDGAYYPIPYDFDWTGFVDAPYAGPNPLTEHLHDSVRERVYWGACLPGIDYPGIFARFLEERKTLVELVQNQEGLTDGNKRSAVEYLEEFFEILEDPRDADRRIIKSCRK